MKKLFILLFGLFFVGFSQDFNNEQCLTGHYNQMLWTSSGSQSETGLSYNEAKLLEIENSRRNFNDDRSVITVPVIFHVVLTATNHGNVTDQDIQDQLTELNAAFSNTGSNSASVRTNLWTGVDAQIQFCMAQREPNGNQLATPGVERKTVANDNFTLSTNLSQSNAFKNPTTGLGSWDREKYLNIWITGLSNGVAGFAFAPPPGEPLATLPSWIDGATIDWQVGMDGVNLPHEVGHVLGLDHTFGFYSCTSDDGFHDTPNTDNAA